MVRSSGPCRDQRGMSGSVQVTLLLPLAMLVLLAALQWSLLLWAESTAMAAAQDSAEDGREAGRRALFNSALGDATVKVDRAAAFTTAVVEGTAIRVLPMVDVTVHQVARVPTERIR